MGELARSFGRVATTGPGNKGPKGVSRVELCFPNSRLPGRKLPPRGGGPDLSLAFGPSDGHGFPKFAAH